MTIWTFLSRLVLALVGFGIFALFWSMVVLFVVACISSAVPRERDYSGLYVEEE